MKAFILSLITTSKKSKRKRSLTAQLQPSQFAKMAKLGQSLVVMSR